MTETMNERKRKAPRFHLFHTFAYLPFSIAVGLFVALGNTYAMKSMSFSSVVQWVDFVHLLYPWVATVLSLVALPLLIGRYPEGRRVVLFSEMLKSLLALTMVCRYFYFGHMLQGFVYSLLVILMGLVYAYYRKIWWYFLPEKRSTEEEKETVGKAEEETAAEPPFEEEAFEVEPLPEENGVEEPMEKEETKETEESSSPLEEEEVTLSVRECGEEEISQEEKVKITSYIPSFFFIEEPLVVEEVTLTVCEKRTLMEIKVLNVSASDFFESEWRVNDTKSFVSSTPLFSGKEATIRAMITVPTDRVDISLLSMDGKCVERKTFAPLPEKKALSSLSPEENFPYFLSDFAKVEDKRISWVYSENVGNSAWLCPRCGSPSIGEKCTACSMDRLTARRFSKESVLEEYRKASDGDNK